MASFQILHQITSPARRVRRERMVLMLVHQLTVVHQLPPPLEDAISD